MPEKLKIESLNTLKREEKNKLSDFPKNEVNPYLYKAFTKLGRKKQHYKVNSEEPAFVIMLGNDEANFKNITGLETESNELIDRERFIKFFIPNLSYFNNLPGAAYRIFFSYILPNLRKDSDQVEFNIAKCKKMTNYSSVKDIYKGLSSLLKVNIIARGYNNIYYINPTIVFNGDRRKLAQGSSSKNLN